MAIQLIQWNKHINLEKEIKQMKIIIFIEIINLNHRKEHENNYLLKPQTEILEIYFD